MWRPERGPLRAHSLAYGDFGGGGDCAHALTHSHTPASAPPMGDDDGGGELTSLPASAGSHRIACVELDGSEFTSGGGCGGGGVGGGGVGGG